MKIDKRIIHVKMKRIGRYIMALKEKTKPDFSLMANEEIDEYKRNKRKTAVQAVKYALCTLSAGIIELVTFTILMEILPNYISREQEVMFIQSIPLFVLIATTVSLGLSILWNFTINRKITFKTNGNVPRAMFLVFLFYVPFFPFKIWFNGAMPEMIVSGLGLAAAAGVTVTAYLASSFINTFVEICSLLMNGILEFCWQKFFVYRNEEDSALANYKVGEIGEFGEITVEKPEFTGMELNYMMSSKLDINSMSSKQMRKWLNKN